MQDPIHSRQQVWSTMTTTLKPFGTAGRAAPASQGAEAILAAVVFGAQNFMNQSDWTGVLDVWLARLGAATGSGKVRVFKNDVIAAGEATRASMYAEWRAPGAAGSPKEALQHVPFRASGCSRWEDLLSRAEPVVGNTEELPECERAILRNEGVRSVAMVPVFAGTRWWGFIGFADCNRERTWTEAELNALAAAAGIYGAALARREMEQRIAAAIVHERLAAEIGQVLTTGARNIDDILQRCSVHIGRHLGADLVRVWTTDLDGGVLRSRSGTYPIDGALLPSEVAIGEYGVGRIAASKQPEVWRGTVPELWPGSLQLIGDARLTSGAGHPLMSGGSVVGVVVMLQRAELTSGAVEGLFSVTDELAVAIERSRAMSALHLTEDRYRRLVEATVEGICIHDGKRIHDANPSLAAMVGYEVSEIIGQNPFGFIHPDHHPEVIRNITNNYTRPYEAKLVRRDGTVVPVEIKGRDFFHDGMKLRVTSLQDLTERKEAERTAQKLREESNAREVAERNRRHAEFLVEASRILASSFDTSTTLTQLAHLAVRFLADFCVVTLFRGDVSEQVALVAADPSKAELLAQAVESWNRQWQEDHPFSARQRQGEPFIVSSLSADDLDEMAPDAEHRKVVEALGTKSIMSVPISSGGELIGAMMFASAGTHAHYGAEELSIAQELARRAAVALQSAQSYHDAMAATLARDEMLAVVA